MSASSLEGVSHKLLMAILFFNCTDTDGFQWVVDVHCTILLLHISNTCVIPITFISIYDVQCSVIYTCNFDSFKKKVFAQIKIGKSDSDYIWSDAQKMS